MYSAGRIVPEDSDGLKQYKQSLKDGQSVMISFEPWSAARTRAQQGLAHEIMGRIRKELRLSLDSVKCSLKVHLGYYIPAEKLLSGEIGFPPWSGRFYKLSEVYEGDPRIVFLRSESSYTKAIEKELIDAAIWYAQQSDVNIGDILQTMEAIK
jgi:hypothetical protein